ncbi:MAG TPA: hypothetical protein VFU19_13915 [Iamia sp.]|nr:hypothetical protein [Iamia sp.]
MMGLEPTASLPDQDVRRSEAIDAPPTFVDVISAGGLKDRDDHIRREAIPL